MNYHEYLQSDDWKYKRNNRLLYDKKCSICGRPFDLEVHHVTYKNVPYEKMSDLLTVCRNCHQRIEDHKAQPWYDSTNIILKLLAWQFCKEYKDKDYSRKGDLNLTSLDVIKQHFFPYVKEHLGIMNQQTGVSIIQEYFRNERYKVILKYMENGAEPYIVLQQTKFNSNMVYKVYNNPEMTKRIVNKGIYFDFGNRIIFKED